MLSRLKLQNLILVQATEIEFSRGLNIFTGETGSGKSALLTAIRLIAGQRAETEWIRSGASSAIVEAEIFAYSMEMLKEIDLPPSGEPLTLRRELHRSGKSRCFVEDRLVSVGFLRDLVRPVLEIIDQGSAALFSQAEEERRLLDVYARLESEVKSLSESFSALIGARSSLEEAMQAEAMKSRNLAWAEESLKEIVEVNWQKGEEEKLAERHTLLTHIQELTEKIGAAVEGIGSIAPRLRPLSHLLDSASSFDARLKPAAESLKAAALELDEAERALLSYAEGLEADPGRLAAIEERIGAIEMMKRRYGPTWEEVEQKKKHFAAEIERLAHLEETRSTLERELRALEEKTASLAAKLSAKRQSAAKAFAQAIIAELKCLNLPHVQFEIQLAPKPLSANGTDEIRYLFSANPGLSPLPLDQCASGGEISRLLFAAKVALAEKEKIQCLVFDEIDSNVGGQTAAVLGEKLRRLSESRQVICVTHFIQVARFAESHFAVSKKENEGRAATSVSLLRHPDEREREYVRMVGKS